MRTVRRHPVDLRVGDGLDFWRVITLGPPYRMLLLAEMKTPGDALLKFNIQLKGEGRITLEMVARFLPRGLFGILYWYALFPTHQWLSEGMLKKVAQKTGKRLVEGPEAFKAESSVECKL
jgi:hypothetical protein